MPSVRRLVSEEAFQDMDYLLPTVSKDFAGLIPRPSKIKDAILRQGVTPGPRVGEAAVVALAPGVHPGLRLPDGDPPPGQLAHGEHGRCLRAGEAQRGCGDLGPGSAEGPQPEPWARQGTQGGLESPGLGGPAPATRSGHHGRRSGGPRGPN